MMPPELQPLAPLLKKAKLATTDSASGGGQATAKTVPKSTGLSSGSSAKTGPVDSTQKGTDIDAQSGGKRTKRQQVEAYLKGRFQFRYNELTGGIEYSPAGQDHFVILNDYRLNSLCRAVDNEKGIDLASGALLSYLQSSFTQPYHPLIDYFESLPPRPGQSTIQAVAATVQVANGALFAEALQRWMVSTIANAVEQNKQICRNQTCLVLTGGQGKFKTTWLNGLCPPALTAYRFTGKINLDAKDTLILLATKLMINLDDQLRELNKKDADTVKTLISHGSVTVRRPYDKITSELERVASFMASVNHDEFLSDSTGSRRFFPFKVLGIDLEGFQQLDIDLAWAEANTLYRSGYHYWWSADEVAQQFEDNEAFQVVTAEEELLHHYFEVVTDERKATVCLPTTMILSRLQEYSRLNLSARKLGEALRKAGAIRQNAKWGPAKGSKAFCLRERTGAELNELTATSGLAGVG